MNLPKLFLYIGILFLAAGGLLWVVERLGGGAIFSRLGNLPGDIRIERGNFRFYFPLTTCLLLSGVLTLIVQIVKRVWK